MRTSAEFTHCRTSTSDYCTYTKSKEAVESLAPLRCATKCTFLPLFGLRLPVTALPSKYNKHLILHVHQLNLMILSFDHPAVESFSPSALWQRILCFVLCCTILFSTIACFILSSFYNYVVQIVARCPYHGKCLSARCATSLCIISLLSVVAKILYYCKHPPLKLN
jgi:hypothetical protein